MKQFSLLFFCFLFKKLYAFSPKPSQTIHHNELEYREDDWDHGEVEWDFQDKYTILEKIKYTSLLNTHTHYENKNPVKNNIIIENNNTKFDAIYYGTMETINNQAVNFQEILLNIQNICFVKTDSDEDITKDIYILLLIYSIKTNYELSKNREKYILSKLYDAKNYLKIKKIASCIILIIITIFCRNVNNAE